MECWTKDAQDTLTIAHSNLNMRFHLQRSTGKGFVSFFERTALRMDIIEYRRREAVDHKTIELPELQVSSRILRQSYIPASIIILQVGVGLLQKAGL